MLQTRLLPASMCVTVVVMLMAGLYYTGRADAASDDMPSTDRGQETHQESFLDRAVRTRAGELVKRVHTDFPQECSCPS